MNRLTQWIARWWAPPESICEQRLRAWFPEAYADRQAGRGPVTSGASARRAADGVPTAPEQERAPGCSFEASADLLVQRCIEIQAMLDAAWRSPDRQVLILPHQTDRHGEEIRH